MTQSRWNVRPTAHRTAWMTPNTQAQRGRTPRESSMKGCSKGCMAENGSGDGAVLLHGQGVAGSRLHRLGQQPVGAGPGGLHLGGELRAQALAKRPEQRLADGVVVLVADVVARVAHAEL